MPNWKFRKSQPIWMVSTSLYRRAGSQKARRHLANDSAILFTTVNIDGDGARLLPREALKIIGCGKPAGCSR
jgi:hypothetical protein